MERKSEGSFARKVRNRKFAIDNSWKKDAEVTEESVFNQNKDGQDVRERWTLLHENLAEANADKYYDGYPVISSNRKYFGKIIVFVKRAIRKVLKHTMGWYIFPFYETYSRFAGKTVNVISLEREFLYLHQEQINKLSATIADLTNQIELLNEKIDVLSKNVEEKDNYLYAEIVSQQQKQANTSDRLGSMEELQKTVQNKQKEFQKNVQNGQAELRCFVEAQKKLLKETEEKVKLLKEADAQLHKEVLENRMQLADHEAYIADETWTEDESFYHDLEECFRGERELIKQRQEQYVPVLKSYIKDWSKGTFVDLGSGRGEWLDVLKENGAVDYVGIDLNERQNEISRSFGHPVLKEDCVTYLESLENNSVDVISGFQIIEHLSRKSLQEVFQQSYRVLKSGGMILFETPNPQNVEVGASTFYLDPTHEKPLHPLYLEYIAKRNGFIDVQMIYTSSNFNLDEINEEDKTVFSELLTNRVLGAVNMLYGPKDYCILAIKE